MELDSFVMVKNTVNDSDIVTDEENNSAEGDIVRKKIGKPSSGYVSVCLNTTLHFYSHCLLSI